jgi:hypothetical protein
MKTTSIFLIYLFLFSCEGTTNKSDQKYSEEQVDESEYIEIEAPPPKQLEWANGNIYSYDFTETITKKDSLGIETFITVYKNNPPNEFDIICEKKVCKWCGKEVYAENYSIEEYPNINWVRGQPDLSSIFGMFSVIFEGKTYYDFDNNRIRTEWRINCNYPGPDEFCSLKCENEYDYR